MRGLMPAASAEGELSVHSTRLGKWVRGPTSGRWRTTDSLTWAAACTGTRAHGGSAAGAGGAGSEAIQMDMVRGSSAWGFKLPFQHTEQQHACWETIHGKGVYTHHVHARLNIIYTKNLILKKQHFEIV